MSDSILPGCAATLPRTTLLSVLLRERPPGATPAAPSPSEARAHRLRQLRETAVRLRPRLLKYVMRITGKSPEFAHDVVQDALVAAWSNLDKFRDDGHLRPWLYRVARFKAIDRIRKQGPHRRPMLSLDAPTTHGKAFATVLEARPPIPFDPQRLRDALADLPTNYIGAVRLHYFHGLSVRETADVLGLAPSTVKMRLYRARAWLRRVLGRGVPPKEGDGCPPAQT